jgi:hypothetical protein
VKVEQVRANVFRVTATGQELSAFVAAARMALDMLLDDPAAPADAVAMLERVLADYDRALERE